MSKKKRKSTTKKKPVTKNTEKKLRVEMKQQLRKITARKPKLKSGLQRTEYRTCLSRTVSSWAARILCAITIPK